MAAYYDTGVLVPLYVEETFSDAVTTLVESRNEAVLFNLFHRLEMENAVRLKVFRNEMDSDRGRAVIRKIGSSVDDGRLARRNVNWVAALEKARDIGKKATAKAGCRTLDMMHIAIAVQWDCDLFITADSRQLRAAHLAGLDALDLREYDYGQDGSTRGPGAVKEKRSRYRVKKRK